MTFTLSDIKKMPCAPLNQKIIKELEASKKTQPKPEPTGLKFMKWVLDDAGIVYVPEYRFDTVRKFRFDLAIVPLKIGIEYEGLVATGKKGGHQTKKHYTKDTEKYNLCQQLGWRVLRYTTLNYKDFESDLKAIICPKPL